MGRTRIARLRSRRAMNRLHCAISTRRWDWLRFAQPMLKQTRTLRTAGATVPPPLQSAPRRSLLTRNATSAQQICAVHGPWDRAWWLAQQQQREALALAAAIAAARIGVAAARARFLPRRSVAAASSRTRRAASKARVVDKQSSAITLPSPLSGAIPSHSLIAHPHAVPLATAFSPPAAPPPRRGICTVPSSPPNLPPVAADESTADAHSARQVGGEGETGRAQGHSTGVEHAAQRRTQPDSDCEAVEPTPGPQPSTPYITNPSATDAAVCEPSDPVAARSRLLQLLLRVPFHQRTLCITLGADSTVAQLSAEALSRCSLLGPLRPADVHWTCGGRLFATGADPRPLSHLSALHAVMSLQLHVRVGEHDMGSGLRGGSSSGDGDGKAPRQHLVSPPSHLSRAQRRNAKRRDAKKQQREQQRDQAQLEAQRAAPRRSRLFDMRDEDFTEEDRADVERALTHPDRWSCDNCCQWQYKAKCVYCNGPRPRRSHASSQSARAPVVIRMAGDHVRVSQPAAADDADSDEAECLQPEDAALLSATNRADVAAVQRLLSRNPRPAPATRRRALKWVLFTYYQHHRKFTRVDNIWVFALHEIHRGALVLQDVKLLELCNAFLNAGDEHHAIGASENDIRGVMVPKQRPDELRDESVQADEQVSYEQPAVWYAINDGAHSTTTAHTLDLHEWLLHERPEYATTGPNAAEPQLGAEDAPLLQHMLSLLWWMRRWHTPHRLSFLDPQAVGEGLGARTSEGYSLRHDTVVRQAAGALADVNIAGCCRLFGVTMRRLSENARKILAACFAIGSEPLSRFEEMVSEWCVGGLVDRSPFVMVLERQPHRHLVSGALGWRQRVATFRLQDRVFATSVVESIVEQFLRVDSAQLELAIEVVLDELLAQPTAHPLEVASVRKLSGKEMKVIKDQMCINLAQREKERDEREGVKTIEFAPMLSYVRENYTLLQLLRLTMPRHTERARRWLESAMELGVNEPQQPAALSVLVRLLLAACCGLHPQRALDYLDVHNEHGRFAAMQLLAELGELLNEKNFVCFKGLDDTQPTLQLAWASLEGVGKVLRSLRDHLTKLHRSAEACAVFRSYVDNPNRVAVLLAEVAHLHSFIAEVVAAREAVLPPLRCDSKTAIKGHVAELHALMHSTAHVRVTAAQPELLALHEFLAALDAAHEGRQRKSDVRITHVARAHEFLDQLARVVRDTDMDGPDFDAEAWLARAQSSVLRDEAVRAHMTFLCIAVIGSVSDVQVHASFTELYDSLNCEGTRLRHGDRFRDRRADIIEVLHPAFQLPALCLRLLFTLRQHLRKIASASGIGSNTPGAPPSASPVPSSTASTSVARTRPRSPTVLAPSAPPASVVSNTDLALLLSLYENQLAEARATNNAAYVSLLQQHLAFLDLCKRKDGGATAPAYDPSVFRVTEVDRLGYCFYESVAAHVQLTWREVKARLLQRLAAQPLALRQIICSVWALEYPGRFRGDEDVSSESVWLACITQLYGSLDGRLGDGLWADQVVVGMLAHEFAAHAVVIHRADYEQPWVASAVQPGNNTPTIRLLQDLYHGRPVHFRPLHPV